MAGPKNHKRPRASIGNNDIDKLVGEDTAAATNASRSSISSARSSYTSSSRSSYTSTTSRNSNSSYSISDNKLLSAATKSLSTKEVSFDPYIRIRLVAHHREISDEQQKQLWYTTTDFEKIRHEIRLTLRLAKAGVLAIDKCDDLSLRGLENTTQSGYTHCKTNRLMATEAVLYEQERQEFDGIHSPERMAKVYFDAASHCRRAARCVGMRDAQDAKYELEKAEEVIEYGGNDYDGDTQKLTRTSASKRSLRKAANVAVENASSSTSEPNSRATICSRDDPNKNKITRKRRENIVRKRLWRFLKSVKINL